MLWKVYKHTGNVEDYTNYKEALNLATTEIRKSKRTFEQKLAGNIKNDSKSFYAYVRSKQKVRDKVGPLENNSENIISDGFRMAEVLNEYFSSVFTTEDISSLPVPLCKCIHIGHGNMDEEYKMEDPVLGRTTQEKDLGVTFNDDMKVSEQCGIAASKGNQILGLIRRTITYKEKHLIVPLYKAIVRPHLEYCIQAWRPYRKKDIDKLERIQRRATKMIPELRDLSYESRLLQCGLITLETRRLRD